MLAAGKSQRFGSPKQIASLNGQPLIVKALAPFFEQQQLIANLDSFVLVLGAYQQTIKKILPSYIKVHTAQDWQLGMGHSLSSAVKAAPEACNAVMVTLADQVALSRFDVCTLIKAYQQHPDRILVSEYAGQLGVPAIFPKHYFSQLGALTGDKGAKPIIEQYAKTLIRVPCSRAALDIDTVQDLAKLADLTSELD